MKVRELNFLQHFHADDLIMSAVSWYVGRQTIQVDDFCGRLVAAWDDLPKGVREFTKRVVEDAFHRRTILRTSRTAQRLQCGMHEALDPWEKVRACWANPTKANSDRSSVAETGE